VVEDVGWVRERAVVLSPPKKALLRTPSGVVVALGAGTGGWEVRHRGDAEQWKVR
jgi:hypothetical protein